MNNNFNARLCLLLHKGFKLLGRSYYYENRYGIKVLNRPPFVNGATTKADDIVTLNPEDFFLGFDGLKDPYSLVGVCVVQSPHFDLISAIHSQGDFSGCDYIIREAQGYLDGRFAQKVNDADIQKHRRTFKQRQEEIINDTYDPPIVYQIDHKYYVLDGKHRIAMCQLFGKKVRCRLIDAQELLLDPYNNSIYNRMMRYPERYSRNLKLMNSIMKDYEEIR